MKQAVILAGGKGTRLKERLGGLPKPLIDICGIPLLERQILLLKDYGFNNVFILVNYASEKIIEFCKQRNNWGITITCIDDGKPLGTAGATLKIFDLLANDFLVMYGDTMLDVDLNRFYDYHLQNPRSAATLFLHPNDHPLDSDLVETDNNGMIINFHPYPHNPSHYYPNLVNAALYWIKKDSLTPWRYNTDLLDFAKDLFPLMLTKKLLLRGYNSIEYIKDCGTPIRVDQVCNDLTNNKIYNSSLKCQHKAVFIDRDGTINKEVDHLNNTEQFKLFPNTATSIKSLNTFDYLTCVISNQPVVARGECSFSELKQIHNKMETLLGQEGAFINRIYFCPHHPDAGYPGEIKELKYNCTCRKPSTGMIDQAVQELNIDVNKSWFIGDTTTDILTAKRAGLKSILVETGYAGLDQKFLALPDFIVPDLNKAINFILSTYPEIYQYCNSIAENIKNGDQIIIGGNSRSGKTTFANVLREVLKNNQINCHVISLDRWIKSETEREQGVMGRYDTNEIQNVLIQLNDFSLRPFSIKLPSYNKLLRKQFASVEKIDIEPNDIIIIEGTIALSFQSNNQNNKHRYYIELDENLRKQRVINEYLIRGFSEQKAQDTYSSRIIDESAVIQNTFGNCTFVNMNEFYQHIKK